MRRGRRAIVLLTTLQLIAFIFMLTAGVVMVSSQSLLSIATYSERELALNAARMGATYLQARLESDAALLAPGSPPANLANPGQGLRVVEMDRTIIGEVDNSNVAGPDDRRIRLFFRATFASSITTHVASENPAYTVNAAGIPPCRYISCNNLLKPAAVLARSFQASGAPYRDVAGGTADLIVEGFAAREDGVIRARRLFEACFTVQGVGNMEAAALIASTDVNCSLLQSGGTLKVGVEEGSGEAAGGGAPHGIVAGTRIQLCGPDTLGAGASSPPGYTQSLKSAVPPGGDLSYRQDGGSSSSPGQFAHLYDQVSIAAPNIQASDLPSPRSGASQASLAGGTWVAWNGRMLHYPVAYDATRTTLAGGTDPAVPPTLGGVAPTSQALPRQVGFDATKQQLSVGSVDLQVTPYSAGGGAIQDLHLLAAPRENQPAGAESAALQLLFNPGDQEATPQLRVGGNFEIVGNVLGRGSLIATGNATSAGDIRIQGKGQLDPGSDSGVALYSAGDTRIVPIDVGQPPKPLETFVEQPPAGIAGSPVFQALASALQQRSAVPGVFSRTTTTVGGVPHTVLGIDPTQAADPSTGDVLKDVMVTVNLADGTQVTGQLKRVLGGIYARGQGLPDVGVAGTEASRAEIDQMLASFLVSANDFSPTAGGGGVDSYVRIPTSTFNNWAATGTKDGSTPSPSPTAGPVPSPTAPSTRGLDQEFNGLTYARGSVIVPGSESFRLRGSMVAYGGKVEIAGRNIEVNFSPSRIANFASFFGNRVVLSRKFSGSL